MTGAEGRTVFFRAERFRPRRLLRRIAPRVEVDAEAVHLHDLSATGLSFWATVGKSLPDTGSQLPIRMALGEVEAFSAAAEIVRHQPFGERVKVGLRFLDNHVVPDKLRALHDRLVFEQSLAVGLDAYDAVPTEYRHAVDRARLFVEHWRQLLDDRERVLRASNGDDLQSLLAAVETAAEARMREEWRAIHAEASATSRDIVDGEALAASKRYTETMLTSALRDVPLIWHTYSKPLGYPGDFQAMSAMYEGKRRGDSIFARVMDQLGQEERLAATVIVRKRFLVGQLEDCVSRCAASRARPVRVVSIGSGPAREIADYLKATAPGPHIEFVLVDQDELALAFASEQLREAAQPHGDRVRILYRHLSFAQLFALPHLVDEVRDADMIYTAGLFDYLGPDIGRALMKGCFDLLRAGGRLVVGNAATAPGIRWMPEFVLDWTMIYRTEAQLRELARDFEERASIEIDSDDSAAWLFLMARAEQHQAPTPDRTMNDERS